MSVIKSFIGRKVLNSHVQFTNEFIIVLEDGAIGEAASPQGETISVYEDRGISIDPSVIIKTIINDGLIGKSLNQTTFDQYLQDKIPNFGRNNAYGISEAFFEANRKSNSLFEYFDLPRRMLDPPRLCLNILNGGKHAYTNPVLSDFSEFILVAKNANITEVIEQHNEIQHLVKEKLLALNTIVVAGNPVHCFGTCDNREVLDFLMGIVSTLGFSDKYDLMIDASSGDLWQDEGYRLDVTDGRLFRKEEFLAYWLELIRQYPLQFLEDPFFERDFQNWNLLSGSQQLCCIVGDNLYSSNTERILEGAKKKYATGAVIKLNQAGTVTAFRQAVDAATSTGQIVMTSHRSISMGSTLLSILTCLFGAPYIKIGPLTTDFSSVLRLNEIIRMTEKW